MGCSQPPYACGPSGIDTPVKVGKLLVYEGLLVLVSDSPGAQPGILPGSPAVLARFPKPPLTLRSILELTWGMTMKFSHEIPQREFGRTVESEFIKLANGSLASDRQMAFTRNLLAAIAKTLRNMGFVRDNHIRYLDDLGRQFKDKEDDWRSLGDFTSLSKAGFPTKILSLLGIGSAAGFLGSGLQLALNIATSVLSGIAGAFLITLALRQLRDGEIEKARTKITAKQNAFWKDDFKPDMSNLLFSLYLDVQALVKEYYSEYDEAKKPQNDMLGWERKQVEYFINNNILPPDTLSWPPYPFETKPAGHVTTPTSSPSRFSHRQRIS